ncbi:unnamed protein product [Ixodes pacificus]
MGLLHSLSSTNEAKKKKKEKQCYFGVRAFFSGQSNKKQKHPMKQGTA